MIDSKKLKLFEKKINYKFKNKMSKNKNYIPILVRKVKGYIL